MNERGKKRDNLECLFCSDKETTHLFHSYVTNQIWSETSEESGFDVGVKIWSGSVIRNIWL